MRLRRPRSGFTLLEMIIVLALIAISMGLVAPQLSHFIRGRDVQEEARRMLALTRFAAAESISHGERFELWFAPQDGLYGVRIASGVDDPDAVDKEFRCAEGLTLEIPEVKPNAEGEVVITFWPDGSIDEESPVRIELLERDVPVRALELSSNRLGYALVEIDP